AREQQCQPGKAQQQQKWQKHSSRRPREGECAPKINVIMNKQESKCRSAAAMGSSSSRGFNISDMVAIIRTIEWKNYATDQGQSSS
ncbi:hypothetical protein Ancab_012166, partial [Ancistrocladus abbreviatus]